jgi:O-acetyl-ADP-ribose deacetylase (regulator of RNase III)
MEKETLVSRPVGHGRIELVLGNIVEQEADAIVNAANTKLSGGGGVDGAIHRAAGKALKEECARFPADERGRRCPTGQVRVTGAGNLPAKYLIHAVGPFYNERYAAKGEQQLREVFENLLAAAVKRRCRSVAVPAISTGAYRFPIKKAAAIALQTVADFLAKKKSLQLVRFVLYKRPQFQAFQAELKKRAPSASSG